MSSLRNALNDSKFKVRTNNSLKLPNLAKLLLTTLPLLFQNLYIYIYIEGYNILIIQLGIKELNSVVYFIAYNNVVTKKRFERFKIQS